MKLTFLGGADEVGASATLLEIGGKQILVDAGIRISPRTSRGIQNSQLPDLHPISAINGPDYIIVTHAHTDHTGALPLILEQYPDVPVLATQPTIELVRVLQNDAQRIMKNKQEEEGELPLFDEISVNRLMDAFQIVTLGQTVKLGENVQVTFHTSGHIVGAAALVFESTDGTLVMSGDLSLTEQRAVVKAQMPRIKADALILESTYGGRLHANRVAEEVRLIEKLKEVTGRGGKVLIPAFALGRAQEIIQIILAYRDQLDVPVYVDGMVRSVCMAYSHFADLLPKVTIKNAGDQPLFFRDKVQGIKNLAHRSEIAFSTTPCVVVASSGMLTGGASAFYAKYFAPDDRNAILLTGYQDEEAPGRFLQKMMQERQEGDEATIKIDGQPVKVRSEINTYSLSAHADESELISIAEALNPDEIMLVHGDPAARHSLATKLRQRGRVVTNPKIGQTKAFAFTQRPWAVGKVGSGGKSGAVNIAELWNALKDNVGSFFSARELAQVWWGDGERAEEMAAALQSDTTYFSADWRSKNTFKVRTPEQIAQSVRSQQIMLAYPDLVGQLVALRNSNNQPRLGIVTSGGADSFEAEVPGTRGTHFPGNALLWALGSWEGFPEGTGRKGQLSAMSKALKPVQDLLIPYEVRQKLVLAQRPVLPDQLVPETLPEGLTRQMALAAVVMSLAEDGATLEPEGLLPKRAMEHGLLDQNDARTLALALFPPEARLRKVGMEVHRKRIVLSFDFPDIAANRYDELVEQIMDQTGWDVQIKPTVNQQALLSVIHELMPEGGIITKGPSLYMDRNEVEAQFSGLTDEQIEQMQQAYKSLTGFKLRSGGRQTTEDSAAKELVLEAGGQQMEINMAYGVIKDALNAFGLYRTSLKGSQIVLTFISPQVGERHLEMIQQLAQKTGYSISIHPHPNQQQILEVARQLIRRAGWTIQKGPGIHMDRAEVAVKLAENPPEDFFAEVNGQMELETGYRLVLH